MIICAECGHEEFQGALFCTECGEHLLELGGMPAVSDQITIERKPNLLGHKQEVATRSQEIMFMIPSSGRRINLPFQNKIRIGRGEPDDPHAPELNLTQDDGSAAGVSREHAEIRISDDGISLVIIDLNSTNGTFLNHFRLPPQLPYPVAHGDEIYFANLVVHVFFR